MLRALREFEGYKVEATDGVIGAVCDVCFDDQDWTIRYLVVDTGGFWQGPHRVLISPSSFGRVDWSTHHFHVALDRQKVHDSPGVDMDKPVSRQFEIAYYQYYHLSPYWNHAGEWNWGLGALPGAPVIDQRKQAEADAEDARKDDPHLRSVQAITGYQVNSGSDVLGYVTDFIVDEETWKLRYFVIETHKWWFGKKVLMSPLWAQVISWNQRSVYTDIPRDTFKNSPEWSADNPINRQYETRLYDYHGQPAYWLDTDQAKREDPTASAPPTPPTARGA